MNDLNFDLLGHYSHLSMKEKQLKCKNPKSMLHNCTTGLVHMYMYFIHFFFWQA